MEINIDLLIKGDTGEFEKFVHIYRVSAEIFAMNIVHDNYLVEDIVQDSFAKLYVYRDKINPDKSLKAYFFSIVKNLAIDNIRKSKKVMYKEFEIIDTVSPENIMLKQERNNFINENINNLKPLQRYAIYLYVYENLNYKEIGTVLGKTDKQIKAIIFRARKKLKKNMGLVID
ncbi:RNA polymerase subunit sigma-24 [Vallitalea longa]|uniref:RNA polymerase subunit sigma-24 n=1 Tax=Vallitalea longa TaxID=2936439 RepID=A0A9W5YJ12_9FIRM|nr:RNA polymerase sigma factor [Vallitalea longa]GKX32233.1 RNA polymerase subunit sigma-24 [Vallitalea longa]